MYIGSKFLFRIVLFFSFIWLLFKFLLPFLFPFLLGTGLALLAEPAVQWCRKRLRLPGALSSFLCVSLCFLLLGGLIVSLLALLLRCLSPLSNILPVLADTASSGLDLLQQWLLSLVDRAPAGLQAVLKNHVLTLFSDSTAFLNQGLKYLLSLAGGLLSSLPDQAFTLFTAFISGFMISCRLKSLKKAFINWFSRQKLQSLKAMLLNIRETAGRWLLAQLKLSSVTLLVLTFGLVLLKIPYAPLWALAATVLDALPLLGTGLVLIPWSLISFLQGNTPEALGLLATYVTAALLRSLLEPRFVGRQLGLDPLLTLGAIYIGYRLWGFPGMILSPLLAVTAMSLYPRPESPEKSL